MVVLGVTIYRHWVKPFRPVLFDTYNRVILKGCAFIALNVYGLLLCVIRQNLPKDLVKVHFRGECVCPFVIGKAIVRASCRITPSSSLVKVFIGAIGHFSLHEDNSKETRSITSVL